MFNPDFVLLYVDSPTASATFYQSILGHEPIELSATFALFKLESGLKLGLWSKHTVEPAAGTTGGGVELAFLLQGREAVQAQYEIWRKQGLAIAQEPTAMDFGYTFVALDPDAHRLRVYSLE
ncbi:VOC family protein [Iodobacter sp. CM08]|uniref:VOC family protein n=1 Tax=Iodobacter sp. CM08 TaxID=3085902 RepID=UPI00298231F9|nr:VOC family protein [Iodobacter sp. CM08]MDW5418861.1 VOC family protein [Iodobacter sp. CM08]